MGKKLIEVALPLEAINRESAREKSIRHGHPSTLHLWWSRKPLATCRAVLFAQMVDDPSAHPERFPTKEAQKAERERLSSIIEDLVKWENVKNEAVLEAARKEIRASAGGDLPPVLDPFCGGGSIPLEAQRLGLVAYASDLNPVAVLITRALIEIPPKFAGRPPVHPRAGQQANHAYWQDAHGLAEDVRQYGRWMRDEAQRRLGHLYPKVQLPPERGGGEATVIAWLWARTVASPNPACGGAHVPLVSKWWLSTKKGKQAWVEPVVDRANNAYRFEIRQAEGGPAPGTVNRRGATCLISGIPIPLDYVRAEGKAGRLGARLMAIVAEGERGRVYVEPSSEHGYVASEAEPAWGTDAELPTNPRYVTAPNYGMRTFSDLFAPRQLVALTAFSDRVKEARERVLADARQAGMPDDGMPLNDGGTGAAAYADAVATYLGFAVSRLADYGSGICTWTPDRETMRNTFTRQALSMTWDYAECNPFSDSTGNFLGAIEWIAQAIAHTPASVPAQATQLDSTAALIQVDWPVISTDPPYYDNIGYADLSDFFYIWLRRSLAAVYPDIFSTLLVPKERELVADPYRHRGKDLAERYFEQGLAGVFHRLRQAQNPDYPCTVYYAFKQSETDDEDDGPIATRATVSTGWETMLQALVESDFMISGTWPMRTERSNRPRGLGSNALASSIVLVCRPRPADAPATTRREFVTSLKRQLPEALKELQKSSIAPVDLAQAAIGPGMAVFSRYRQVIEADGSAMRVRTALALINQALDEFLAAQEGDYDPNTRWALAWFEQHGMQEGPFGDAETLSKAKNVAVSGLEQAGVAVGRGGKVRLIGRDGLPEEWEPAADTRLTVWETAQHLIRALDKRGEEGAAALLRRCGALGEAARDLAYRLYSICDRKGWAQEGLAYNNLVVSWPSITALAGRQETGAKPFKAERML
jgi:putative DNA methylase